jgi:hypothetical protein
VLWSRRFVRKKWGFVLSGGAEMDRLERMDGLPLERPGNLHLVLLHLPIGIVAATGLLE